METKILLIDSSGYPYKWVGFERAAYYIFKDVVAWIPTDVHYVLNGGVNAATGKESKLRIPSIMAIKGANAGRSKVVERRKTSKALFRRDNFMCCYCGETFQESSLTIDHVIPSSRGGDNSWENLVTACSPCNHRKNDRTPKEAGLILRFRPYKPSKAQYLDFTQKVKLECQSEWLSKYI